MKLRATVEVEYEAQPQLDDATARTLLESSLQRGMSILQASLESASLSGVSTGIKGGLVQVRLVQRHVK